jgi:hypothetical protein
VACARIIGDLAIFHVETSATALERTVRRRRLHRGLLQRQRLHSALGYRTPLEALTEFTAA